MRDFAIGEPPQHVLVANVEGVLYAAQGRCPHGKTLLARGDLCERRVVCLTHRYEFDLVTGRSDEDSELLLRRYPVNVLGDGIFVDLEVQSL